MFGRKARRIKELEADKEALLATAQRSRSNLKRLKEILRIADGVDIYEYVKRIVEESHAVTVENMQLKDKVLGLSALNEALEAEKAKKTKKVVKRKR